MLTPSRLITARKRRGITKKGLSELVGISDRILLAYEKGSASPSEETLLLIAKALRFPVDFFTGHEIADLSPQSASFRALTTLPAFKRDSALAAGELATLIDSWISERFNLPGSAMPDLRGHDPEAAAEALRAEWGLGQAPIKNMIHLLEARGVRVFSLPSKDSDVDAFCFWRGKTPFILLNTSKSAERSRFDAAHELGHLVLHQHGKCQGRITEQEADRFASAFLMPKSTVVAVGKGFLTLESLIRLKKNWKVSLAALNHRMHSLGLISEWLYRRFCIEISEKGFRKSEPDGILHEVPQIFPKVFGSLRITGINRHTIAHDLKIYADELNSLMFGLLIASLDGGKSSPNRNSSTASLRLV